jgi:hypothetical protein
MMIGKKIFFVLLLLPVASAFGFHGFGPSLRSNSVLSKRTSFCGSCSARGRASSNFPARKSGVLGVRANLDALTVLSPTIQAISGAASSFSGVAVLAFVIAFHETGHFLAARLQVKAF